MAESKGKVAVKDDEAPKADKTPEADQAAAGSPEELTEAQTAERAAEVKALDEQEKAAVEFAAKLAASRTMDPIALAGGTSVADLEAAQAAAAGLYSDEGNPCKKCYPKGWPDAHEAGARVSCAHGTWVKE